MNEKLRTFLKEGLPNIVNTVKGFAENFGGIGKAIVGIGGLLVASVILAPITMALSGLKLAFKLLGGSIGLAVKAVKGITNRLPSSIKTAGVTTTNKAGKEVRVDDKRKKVKTGKLASLGRMGLRGARFIPGIGLLAMGASSLFAGGSAAFKEFNKDGSEKAFDEYKKGVYILDDDELILYMITFYLDHFFDFDDYCSYMTDNDYEIYSNHITITPIKK